MGDNDTLPTIHENKRKKRRKWRKNLKILLDVYKFEKGQSHLMRHGCRLLGSSFSSWRQAPAEEGRQCAHWKWHPGYLSPPFHMAIHICFILLLKTHYWHSFHTLWTQKWLHLLPFWEQAMNLKKLNIPLRLSIWKVKLTSHILWWFASTK